MMNFEITMREARYLARITNTVMHRDGTAYYEGMLPTGAMLYIVPDKERAIISGYAQDDRDVTGLPLSRRVRANLNMRLESDALGDLT